MKKILIMLITLVLLTGCSQVKDLSYDDILQTISTKESSANIYRVGYKYHLPRGMKVEDSKLFNEVISSNRTIYYLYVDAISYHNKVNNLYQTANKTYYSKAISFGDKSGYVEINLLENENYLIEIMYNYAKIEVIVEKDNINVSLLNAINILKSIQFNENIIANLLENDILNFMEEEFNIFNTTSSDSTCIQIDNSYHEEEQIQDPDLIN